MNLRAVLSILLAAATGLFGGCGLTKGKGTSEAAVSRFHERLDKGDFAGIYAGTHPDFKKASTEKAFVDLLSAVHRKLGLIKSTTETGWNVSTFNLRTNIVLTYKTIFASGEAVETFTYRMEDDKPILLGYHINSQDLITK